MQSPAQQPLVRLVFTTAPSVDQLLIGYSTFSQATHVAIGLGPYGEWLLHAVDDGVVLEPRSAWLGPPKNQRIVAEFLVLPNVDDGVRQALMHVGERYDTAGLVFVAMRRLMALFAGILQDYERTPTRAQICTRFSMLLDTSGTKIPEWRHLDPEYVSPGDLLRVAIQGPSFRRLR